MECDSILNLDLSRLIKNRLQTKLKWSENKCENLVKKYKNYLCIRKMYPNQHLPPSVEMDTVWHEHILDMKNYENDCNRLFGKVLEHYPYFGFDDDKINPELQTEAYFKFLDLYEKHFGKYELYNEIGDIKMNFPEKEVVTVMKYLHELISSNVNVYEANKTNLFLLTLLEKKSHTNTIVPQEYQERKSSGSECTCG